MKRCQEAGVAVLWLPFDSGYGARGICKSNTDAVIIGEDLNPAEAATKIGQAAAKALTAMGNRAA
jgi:hypothetical protein